MLHPGVEEHRLVNLNELAQEAARYHATQCQAQALQDPDRLEEAFGRILQKGRNRALVLLPLLSGTELPWTGRDVFATSSPGAIAALVAPNASDMSSAYASGGDFVPKSNYVESLATTFGETEIPARTSLRLVCALGPPLSATIPSDDEIEDAIQFMNQCQVWQVEVIQNGIVQHQKLALKLYDDRVRSVLYSFHHFMDNSDRLSEDQMLFDGRTMACNEAAAYRKLSHVQGSSVPRSYGTYEVSEGEEAGSKDNSEVYRSMLQFQLPEGQGPCLGMLTEYVYHISLGTYVYRMLRDQSDAGIRHMVTLVSFS